LAGVPMLANAKVEASATNRIMKRFIDQTPAKNADDAEERE
jgi:hypothetical protein